MQVKIKPALDQVARDTQKQQINDLNRLRKPKQQKKKVPLAAHINPHTSASSKRTHMQSKSTIEPNQQRHYNSPIVNFPHDNLQGLQANTFSFTHILQQNLKNQQFTSLQSSHSPPVTNFQIDSSTSFRHALQNRQSEKASQFSITSISREKLYRDASQINRNSVEISKSRSPLRMVNANKLSNTPKLKETKKNQGEKTFKQLLQSKENEIKLECSQKIFKFLEGKEIKSANDRNLFNCGSASKSNLLSTGAINLSQRCQHQKLPSQLIKTSKENISNKSVIDSSNNEEIKQFFEQSSSDIEEKTMQQRLSGIKYKILRSNQLLEDQTHKYSHNIQSQLIPNRLFAGKNSTEIVERLEKLKKQITEVIEEVISQAQHFSTRITKQIDEQISNIACSQSTGIDWCKISQQLRSSDHLIHLQCQNQILMDRVKAIEGQLHLHSQSKPSPSVYTKYQAEIKDIDSKISLIFEERVNPELQLFQKTKHRTFLHLMEQKLKKLRISLDQCLLYKRQAKIQVLGL